MKIVISDPIAQAGVDLLKQHHSFDVIEAYGSRQDELKAILKDADALIVRSETKVTKDLISGAQNLKAVGRAGVGVDNIDIDAATDQGIVVMNAPSGNTFATAELTFTHMLCSTRPVVQACQSMREGEWNRKAFSGSELHHKTLGILGLGRIGGEIAKRAQAFGMKVLAHDPFIIPSRAKDLGIDLSTMDRIFELADYITIHLPLTERSHHVINKEAFSKMKDGVRIFNCARGGIVDEQALVDGLKSGKIKSAGLDVFEQEPLPEDHPFRALSNVVLTPHLGASTKEAQESVGLEMAEVMTDFLTKGIIQTAVNMGSVDAKTLQFITPYLRLGECLGTFLQQLTPGPLESLKITYWGNIIEFDAMPLTRAIQKGYLRNITGKNINDINAPAKLKELGIEVDVIKSNTEVDYTELIELEGSDAEGQKYIVRGTLIGRTQQPRIVHLNGHAIEMSLSGYLLILNNRDSPGMVGVMGSLLGDEGINIANMALSRNKLGDTALAIYELDQMPSASVVATVKESLDITDVKMIDI